MTPRNPYACHPLLRKGGPHIKSRSNQRSQARENLLDEADEYMQEQHKASSIKSTAKNDTDSEPDSIAIQSQQEQTEGDIKSPFLINLSICQPILLSHSSRPI